ncbi:AAA family ATPase [Catenuloplanes indicus]|uniref:DNA-binding CsgD family transcriptional regulator n=1 Tax=Catenuloplanes indicus TaxID=137267 RepID=A0AAE3VUC6_9ACTN|nr:LuxR family transcriptional regulator [Catenuloplanes indicus]MDQ0364348.1 DNA-binding CsgD family transcriptional regulator [Catenuloplanes indicus]
MPTFLSHDHYLVGRRDEERQLDELIRDVLAGRGGALVLRGEAGIGKSALLAYAADAVPGTQTVRASGSEFEQELPYAGLHQLCLPLLPDLDDLPPRHRDALRSAFGLAGGTPDPFQVGMAALGLLAAAARRRPLLCLIDDAAWLDEASSKIMMFLARRITADPIGMLFAVRSGQEPDSFEKLPGLLVRGLPDEDARALLAAHRPFPLDDQVRDRLVAEAQGNPLALLELPRAGGFAPPDASSVPARVEHGYRARLAGLSAPARLLLTAASADPTGDPGLLWETARLLDIDVTAAGAEVSATGLADFGLRIRFCHPLARSAVYRAATPADRQAVHGALAAATDPEIAPDRRAWHHAQSVTGPDDWVAAELEWCASRAQARGGVAAAAAFLERAVELSAHPGRRIDRTLAAGQAHLDAGLTEAAMNLLNTLEHAALDEQQQAHVELLQGRAAFTLYRDGRGPELMTRAARRLAAIDAEQARHAFVDAVEMSLFAGQGGDIIHRVVAAARLAPPSAAPDLLDALIALVDRGFPAATPLLRRTLFDGDEPYWTRRPALASLIAFELWDQDAYREITEWLVKRGRQSGSPSVLQLGLAQEAGGAVTEGDIGRAIAASAEEVAVADAAGVPSLLNHRLYLAAIRGRRDEFARLVRAAVAVQGPGRITNLDTATATLHNGLADYPAALAAARKAVENGGIILTGPALPELVEAAVNCGEPDTAATALASLTARTEASGTAAGLGIAAYARGLVTGDEHQFRDAIELLTDGGLVSPLGRAHLLYGEWLCRAGRHDECREQLRTAHHLLSRSGHEGFAQRAADGLSRLGEPVRPRLEEPYEQLTMQELAVARLVAAGATSREVAGQLYISKRTVDAHLRNIFRKLGLTSRRQLKDHAGLLQE